MRARITYGRARWLFANIKNQPYGSEIIERDFDNDANDNMITGEVVDHVYQSGRSEPLYA